MLNYFDSPHSKKDHYLIPLLSIFIFIIALFFRNPLYGIFGSENYLSIHMIFELLIITTALIISFQSWVASPHILTSYRLWVGSLFFTLSFIETAHMLSYKGMPFFFSDSSAYKATWFFMIGRFTEVTGILAIILTKDRMVTPKKRWLGYSLAFAYSILWIILVYSPIKLLPELVVEGIGTTALKRNLQYVCIILEICITLIVFFRFRTNKVLRSMLMTASFYLIVADYFFSSYKDVYDITNFVGHWFQLAGFYFLQRGIYREAVEEPFRKQKEAEAQLQNEEEFLATIASQMGEGLLVLERTGKISFMNFEAERLLQWKQEELIGKYVEDFLHVGKYSFKEDSMTIACTSVKEDEIYCHNGVSFPVSYVITPFFENNAIAGFIIVFRDISQQIKDRETIEFMAFHDELTKLPNLRFLKEEWTEMISRQKQGKLALLVMDIDRFTNMNKALGNEFGDLVLQAVADRIRRKLSAGMLFGRLTGDDFYLISPDINDQAEVAGIVKKIHNSLSDPLQIQHVDLNVNVSTGAALYPAHGSHLDELIQHAKIALTEAQQQNHLYVFFHSSMEEKALDRLVLENDLFHALARSEFHLVYQPQVHITSGKIIGLEALLRWHHPVKGIVNPEIFIPIAEDTGLIISIGEWVLRTACRQLKYLHDHGYSSLVMAVNLSIRQFYQKNLKDIVMDVLEENSLSPQFLELEITESMMMNAEHAMQTLRDLKKLGIKIAIDDFGTGYSSLSYLKNLPVDRLKIDQSFIRDLPHNKDGLSVVSMIITLAQYLNLEVIAEGVETDDQQGMLQAKGCQHVQGYLYSPPLPPDHLPETLKRLDHSIST